MERTFISQRFALAPAPGRRSAPTGSVAAVPVETTQPRRGDHDLNPDMLPTRALIPAAVLIGLVERPDGMGVLFTKRTQHLNDHAGQISFPGGRVDATDADAVAAALREAEEEVGLPIANVEMIGRLDTYVTRTGFEVTPCVGFVTPRNSTAPIRSRSRKCSRCRCASSARGRAASWKPASTGARSAFSTPIRGMSITSGAPPPACSTT
jgi:hypothetical protein